MKNFHLTGIIDRFISLLYYSLFLFTPLIMIPFTSELFEFNKLMLIYFITLCISFAWLIKMILYRKIYIYKSFFDLPILLFFVSQLLSTLFSIDPHTSFFGYYGRFNGGLLSLIAYITLYYGFVSNIKNTSLIKGFISKLLKTSLISSTLVILWGLPGKFGYDLSCFLFMGRLNNGCWTDQFRPAERMFSTLGQPNWLGAYLSINFFIAFYFFLKNTFEKNKNKSILYFLYLVLNFSAILFTRSRSSLLALIFGLVLTIPYFLYLFRKKMITSGQLSKIGYLIIALFLCVVFFKTGIQKIDQFISISHYYNNLKSTLKVRNGPIQESKAGQFQSNLSDSGVTTSGDIRKIVWRGAIDLGLKYPLFGTGVETFAYSYYFVRPEEHNLTSEWDYLYNKAHNEYLNYLATTGFTGLGAYLFFILTVIIYSWSNLKSQMSNIKTSNETMKQWNNNLLFFCLIISYLTILITNFFGFSTTTVNIFFYLIPAFIAILSKKHENTKEYPVPSTNINVKQKLLFLLLLLTIGYLLLYLTQYYRADIKYAKGDSLFKSGEYQKAGQLLNEAYNLKKEHVYEDKLSYVLANISLIYSYEKRNDLAQEMRKISDEINKKSLVSSSKNVLYWKTRAKNYYVYYQLSLSEKDLLTAIQSLDQAKFLSPTDPKINYSLAIFYSLLEEESKDQNKKTEYGLASLKEIDESIRLKLNYRDAYFLKGQLLKKAGKTEAARQTFDFILKNINSEDNEVKKELGIL